MTPDQVVGSVSALWRFPVKSMKGESVGAVEVTPRGVVGDRAYALLDVETGKVASAKSVKRFPNLLACRAEFVASPRAGAEAPPVRITLPDGIVVASDAGDANQRLSAFFGREVAIIRSAPEDFTIDQYHPDVEHADPGGYRDTVVEARIGSALFAQAGQPSPVPVGAFFDVFPMSVMTTATLARLNHLRPETRFDARRFRMNVIVDVAGADFVENGWLDRTLALGGQARLGVSIPDPRCVMTTLAQDDLPGDTEVLRTLVQHNRLEVGAMGRFPCAGVYAVVAASGTIAVGDPVTLLATT